MYLSDCRGTCILSKESANLYNNIFSMGTLRALEYILAFILVPYLLRVLGPSNFGAVVFMQGLMGYLVLVVNYGFNLTAPRALARADEEDISFVFCGSVLLVCFFSFMKDCVYFSKLRWICRCFGLFI